jgi:hypothetical protein
MYELLGLFCSYVLEHIYLKISHMYIYVEAKIVNILSLAGACFSPRTIHVGFLVDKVKLEHIFLRMFRFPSASHLSVNSPYSPITVHEVRSILGRSALYHTHRS